MLILFATENRVFLRTTIDDTDNLFVVYITVDLLLSVQNDKMSKRSQSEAELDPRNQKKRRKLNTHSQSESAEPTNAVHCDNPKSSTTQTRQQIKIETEYKDENDNERNVCTTVFFCFL